MTEEKRESTRHLLDELEQGWGAPSETEAEAKTAQPGKTAAKGDPPSSNPDVDSLDLGWLDDLFPDGESSDDADDEEDEEPEPELPDERLDPEAFALAKKARDERMRARKEKKRAKAEAKRARQKAREAVARQKQKAKKSRPVTAKPVSAEPKRPKATDVSAIEEDEPTRPSTPPAKLRAKAVSAKDQLATKKRANTIASVKLLAVVLLVLLGAAALFAVLTR